MNEKVKNAIALVQSNEDNFAKFITANDSGKTSNQAGIYFPKNAISMLFEEPLERGENYDRMANFVWQDGSEFDAKFIYYGKAKDEYRITNFNGRKLPKDDLFILSKLSFEKYYSIVLNPDEADFFLEYFKLQRKDTNRLLSINNKLNEEVQMDLFESNVTNIKIGESVEKIRPAGRHILTIGRDLIKDNYAAIVELVKNSYDADADEVKIIFSTLNEGKRLKITIEDDGHGMSYETVTSKWLVPSTDDKLTRKISPRGRILQGRKGIGRYAASILGDDILMESAYQGELTTIFIDWREFEKNTYLDDVDLLVERFSSSSKNKTLIEITGDNIQLNSWDKKSIEYLLLELKKLIVPIEDFSCGDDFNIIVKFNEFPVEEYSNRVIEVEPFPILDLFDYRISGTVNQLGIANLIYENQSATGILPDRYEFNVKLDEDQYCGDLKIDLRVYDREPEAIQGLIDKGLKDPVTKQSLRRNETKNLLNDLSGVSIYRNGFRVRPYGDKGFDWLLLDKKRVQTPSLRIGSNQIIGFIGIESEENSGLEEKSARDGLKENRRYYGLVKTVSSILNKLEENRFKYRSLTGKGRIKDKTDHLIQSLFDYTDLRLKLNKEFEYADIPEDLQNKVAKIITDKEQDNNRIADELKRKIAEYQGQVTLGKIVNVILHEGRKPFMYFTNHIPLMNMDKALLLKKFNQKILDSLLQKVDDIQLQSHVLVELFEKIDPLAAKRRDNKNEFSILDSIETVRKVFESEFVRKSIKFESECDKNIMFNGWRSDFYVTFTNLVENSIFWFNEVGEEDKFISIKVEMINDHLKIDYIDNGIGIDEKFIEDNLIFEPGFTTKPEGTGLGLAIAGEAMDRNECSLKVEESNSGVHFIIESK